MKITCRTFSFLILVAFNFKILPFHRNFRFKAKNYSEYIEIKIFVHKYYKLTIFNLKMRQNFNQTSLSNFIRLNSDRIR